MNDHTGIEWTDATWNPVTGCTKVSQGCKHCYAERLWPKVAGAEAKRLGLNEPREFTDVRFHSERLRQPIRWRKPRRVFVNSMSDLFHEEVSDDNLVHIFAVMAIARQHTFQVLTKRAKRMFEFVSGGGVAAEVFAYVRNSELGYWAGADKLPSLSWPLPNVWLGVSVEDQTQANHRIPRLLQTPAAARFLSCEPMLGAIDLEECLDDSCLSGDGAVYADAPSRGINWVIAGGESGPGARVSHPDWFRALRDQCAEARVPFFFKQWGEHGPTRPPGWQPVPDQVCSAFVDDSTFDSVTMYRLGKKRAGRTLDGVTHDAFPT